MEQIAMRRMHFDELETRSLRAPCGTGESVGHSGKCRRIHLARLGPIGR